LMSAVLAPRGTPRMEYGQGGDALVHSSRDARFALSARAERPHRLSMMEGINAGAVQKRVFSHTALG
jgi:hypothetical protein